MLIDFISSDQEVDSTDHLLGNNSWKKISTDLLKVLSTEQTLDK